MPSIFGPGPDGYSSAQGSSSAKPAKAILSNEALIDKEVKHIRHRSSASLLTRSRTLLGWGGILVFLVLAFLYFQDVFYFSTLKTTAFNAYVYLQSKGEDFKSSALVDQGAITPGEKDRLLVKLNRLKGNCTYYATLDDARHDAETVLAYIEQHDAMKKGDFSRMSSYNKLRYRIFGIFHLTPPLHWSFLDPSTEDWKFFPEAPEKKKDDVFKNI